MIITVSKGFCSRGSQGSGLRAGASVYLSLALPPIFPSSLSPAGGAPHTETIFSSLGLPGVDLMLPRRTLPIKTRLHAAALRAPRRRAAGMGRLQAQGEISKTELVQARALTCLLPTLSQALETLFCRHMVAGKGRGGADGSSVIKAGTC